MALIHCATRAPRVRLPALPETVALLSRVLAPSPAAPVPSLGSCSPSPVPLATPPGALPVLAPSGRWWPGSDAADIQRGRECTGRFNESCIFSARGIHAHRTVVGAAERSRSKLDACLGAADHPLPSSSKRGFSTSAAEEQLRELKYHQRADATLHDLHEQLDVILESAPGNENFDCDYSDGVITLRLGQHGIFVLNKQAPNQQLWLSSPVSGPARYEWSASNGAWVNARDEGVELFRLLQEELSSLLGGSVSNQLVWHYEEK